MGRQYEPGDECDGNVARALGSDDVELLQADAPVSEEGVQAPIRKTKPIRKASIK